ncbi:MAG TPA: hypothetical protein VGQ09_11300 [Chitinophagaceae bacterium]|jgi:hypothetical protein|nr:hypothetical protein [Chitinophagaceae bacterium]
MKKTQFLSLIFLVFIFGCKKSDKLEPIDNNIIGKWTYVEYFFSIGGPGQWHPVTPANQTIEFKPDGSFVSVNSFLNGATRFEMVDSVTIKFQPASTPSGFILMGYLIKTANRELYLYPISPRCIEGCSNKFKR